MHSSSQTTQTKNWSYWQKVWKQFRKNRVGLIALFVFLTFCLLGLYAPLLASSKPLIIVYQNKIYFPLLRYLFYKGFYTKEIDLFYNILMFILPLSLVGFFVLKKLKKKAWLRTFWLSMAGIQVALFITFSFGVIKDPASDLKLMQARQEELKKHSFYREDPLFGPFTSFPTWDFDLKYMTPYAEINLLLRHRQRKEQYERLLPFAAAYEEKTKQVMPTLWEVDQRNEKEEIERLETKLKAKQKSYEEAIERLPDLMMAYRPFSHDYLMAKFDVDKAQQRVDQLNSRTKSKEYELAVQALKEKQRFFEEFLKKANPSRLPLENARSTIQSYREALAKLNFLKEKREWLETESEQLWILVPAFLRSFHWEDDAGGQQNINQFVPWWELSRINRKDLVAGLIFGIRVSLVVGITAIALSLLIGIPLGMTSGYFAGKTDILICRLIEVWEAMPTFFMLLLIVAIAQTKSIFIVILVLGIFGWTGFGRFIRGEVLKQRALPYVQACHSLGFNHPRIMFSHILPNAIPPILTLLPFSMMAAITSEAGLSFLGLGEEGSTSWGVLMDEGRSVFPGESYLLWPPAILLTLLLVAIALVGDAIRDAIDPKMQQ